MGKQDKNKRDEKTFPPHPGGKIPKEAKKVRRFHRD